MFLFSYILLFPSIEDAHPKLTASYGFLSDQNFVWFSFVVTKSTSFPKKPDQKTCCFCNEYVGGWLVGWSTGHCILNPPAKKEKMEKHHLETIDFGAFSIFCFFFGNHLEITWFLILEFQSFDF